jgi:hypothetical protein
MIKRDVLKAIRADLDPVMDELGFRWQRMWKSSDGWYVRKWDGGRDAFGWGCAGHPDEYRINGFVILRVDAVEELVTPFIDIDPGAVVDYAGVNVNDLGAFVDGPELLPGQTLYRAEHMVHSETDAKALAGWFADLIRAQIDPWWRSLHTPQDLWNADPRWRKFWLGPPHREMHELALAWLCEAECFEPLAAKHLASAA